MGMCYLSSHGVMIVGFAEIKGPPLGMHQLGKVRYLLHGRQRRRNKVHTFHFMELLLCGVTKGKALLPVHFPLCWALPRRQSMLGQAQFSLGIV